MLTIDYQNRKPLYEQVVERIQLLILSGAMEPGTQLPSVRALAVDLSMNPNTIQKAYNCLEKEGYIYPVKGKGNFVSGDKGLKEKQQKLFFETVEQLVKRGRALGVTREEFVKQAALYFEEGEVL
ncbi:MAG: GntR family transcriptional regulator [Candidatus Limivivens sp.]|nr:GntR family transcriptional regulator [Candidatus Limivivens sp.]